MQPTEERVDQAVLVATLKFTVKSFIFSDDTRRLHCMKKVNITSISTIFCGDIEDTIFCVCKAVQNLHNKNEMYNLL